MWCKYHDIQTPLLYWKAASAQCSDNHQKQSAKSDYGNTGCWLRNWPRDLEQLCVLHHMQVGQRVSLLDKNMTMALLKFLLVDQGPAYFFCKRPDIFLFSAMLAMWFLLGLFNPVVETWQQPETQVNRWAVLCANKTLFTKTISGPQCVPHPRLRRVWFGGFGSHAVTVRMRSRLQLGGC